MWVAIDNRSLALRAVGTEHPLELTIGELSRGVLEFGPPASSRTDISSLTGRAHRVCFVVPPTYRAYGTRTSPFKAESATALTSGPRLLVRNSDSRSLESTVFHGLLASHENPKLAL